MTFTCLIFQDDAGPQIRSTEIVGIVGDAKFVWSYMVCVVNWVRPLLSGPFPRVVMRHRYWIPAVYDKQFYKDMFELDNDIKHGNIDVPPGLDQETMGRQLKFFCHQSVGLNIDMIHHFAVRFGWEGVTVGPLHMGTAIKNTYSNWLTAMYYMGLRAMYDRRLRSLRLAKIISRVKSRITTTGKRIVDCRTSADHGDYLTAVMKEGVWPIRHPDVQTKKEFRHNCEMYACDHDSQSLLNAVARSLGMDSRCFEMFLMVEYLHREMIMTVHGGNETHIRYLERVRVYDPTALTFKDIHGSLCIGNDESDDSRWAPSQAFLIFGVREHLFKYVNAGICCVMVVDECIIHIHTYEIHANTIITCITRRTTLS